MKKDEELQKDVQEAIRWEPLLRAAEIGVIAIDGVITLTGTVDSYAKKVEAENAAKNTVGVKVVVEKIEIKFGNKENTGDEEIAKEIIYAFNWNWSIPKDKIMVKVENGWVTLDGEVSWNYQKEATEKVVKELLGVKGISNQIRIQSDKKDEIEKKSIERALSRNWSIYDQDIQVHVAGNNVTLNGTVHSWYQKDEAARIAWNAPGVWTVDNELVIEYDY